jgi:predicted CXXCH cytochrome family protein
MENNVDDIYCNITKTVGFWPTSPLDINEMMPRRGETMRGTGSRRGAPLSSLFVISLGIVLAGALALLAQQPALAAPDRQEATPTPAPMRIESDQQCLDCHTAPDQVKTLPNGDVLYLTLDADRFAISAHGEAEVGCRDCHTDVTAYPHDPLAARSLRQVTISFSERCADCHEDESARVQDSIHAELRAGGNDDAAACADCHNPHYQVKVEPLSRIPATCARCHSGIAQEYRLSVHGAAIMDNENADAPLCITCHGVHTIQDPNTAEWLSKSPQLCASCHADPERMAPYGLNTNVLSTYVADFHGTTTTLFEKQTPDQLPNTPLCIDCHGIHNIKKVTDAESAVIKGNLLITCQKCHPDATENFSDAWLSHYIPSPEHNPLVYYVTIFYQIFVPVTVAGMAVFVASDVGRQALSRWRRKPPAAAVAAEQAPAPGSQPPAAPEPPAEAAPPAEVDEPPAAAAPEEPSASLAADTVEPPTPDGASVESTDEAGGDQ